MSGLLMARHNNEVDMVSTNPFENIDTNYSSVKSIVSKCQNEHERMIKSLKDFIIDFDGHLQRRLVNNLYSARRINTERFDSKKGTFKQDLLYKIQVKKGLFPFPRKYSDEVILRVEVDSMVLGNGPYEISHRFEAHQPVYRKYDNLEELLQNPRTTQRMAETAQSFINDSVAGRLTYSAIGSYHGLIRSNF